MRWVTLAGIVLFIMSCVNDESVMDISNEEYSSAILNGNDDLQGESPESLGVVRVRSYERFNISETDHKRVSCSGTIINKQGDSAWVLTARHCTAKHFKDALEVSDPCKSLEDPDGCAEKYYITFNTKNCIETVQNDCIVAGDGKYQVVHNYIHDYYDIALLEVDTSCLICLTLCESRHRANMA